MKRIVDWLSLTVCAALPLYVIRFKIFAIPTTVLEISILILFLVWFFERGLKIKQWFKFFEINEFKFPVVFLLISAVIATILSFDQIGGLGILKAYFIDPVLLFLVISQRVRDGSGKYVFFGLVIASLWLSILAIVQKFSGVATPLDAKNEILQSRVVGVYNSANSLALFLGPIFSLILGWVISQLKLKSTLNLFLATFFLFLTSFTIILTKSQAAIFAIGLVSTLVMIFLIFSQKLLTKIFKIIIVSSLLLMIFLPILAFFGQNLGTRFGDETLAKRFYLWQATWGLVFDRPLTGAGLDGFRELYGANYQIPAYDELLQYPHNWFLTLWVELGLSGVIVFIWFFLILVKKSISNQSLGLGLMLATSYLLIHGIVDVPYFKNDLSSQFFVLLALLEFKGYKK